MAIQSSGSISNQDLADEFGGSTPHALNEYYRNGGLVPGNNTNVPESGTIELDDFYGAVNEIVHTQSSSTTNMQLSSTFGSNWGSAVPKRLIINSGVTIGATGSYALRINGSMGGTLIIENSGSIQGKGGAANGGNGGNAIQADHTSGVTIINNSGGQIYAGGGGGGKGGNGGTGGRGGNGGTGGGGQYTTQQHLGHGSAMGTWSCTRNCQNHHGSNSFCASTHWTDCFYEEYSSGGGSYECYDCRRNVTHNTNGGSGGAGGNGGGGGAGGNGGRGRGYNQSRHNGSGGSGGSGGAYGSNGSGGGTNAGSGGQGGRGGTGGTGGTGGNGGDWGQNGGGGSSGNTGATGSTGNSGANGNRTGGSGGASGQGGSGGSSGSGGGSRGTYITNRGSLTFTNNGSVAGA